MRKGSVLKKAFATGSALLLGLSTFACPAKAAGKELPFELKAPANVSVKWLEGNDSPTTMSFAFSLDNEFTSFFSKLDQSKLDEDTEVFFADFDFTDIYPNVQVDWALDDVNDEISGWHFNPYWEGVSEDQGLGQDKDGNKIYSDWDIVEGGLNNATETVQDIWVTRGVPDDERWNGNPETKTPGVKDQLREDQYTYYEDTVHIDYTEHTLYLRARLVLNTYNEETGKWKHYFSDWSDTCAYGKDAEKYEPVKPGELDAPVITGLRMTDEEFNDNPVVAFTLSVPDDLAKKVTDVAAHRGSITIQTQARVAGDTEWVDMGNTDWTVKAGEMKCSLVTLAKENEVIPKDTKIELRCRYFCSQEELADITSEWSKAITFGSDDIGIDTNAASTVSPSGNNNNAKDGKCSLCHFCPQPLGLCVFIWLAILVVIIVVVVIIVKKTKKKS